MQQFDKNGDGEISDSEREAIREHFRNGGGPPGRGGNNTGGNNRGGGNRGSGNAGSGGGSGARGGGGPQPR